MAGVGEELESKKPKATVTPVEKWGWRWCRAWTRLWLSKNHNPSPGVEHKCPWGAFFVAYKTPPMRESRSNEAHPLIKSPSKAWQHTVSFQTLPLRLAVEFLLRIST